jgi:hypothetical protein
MRHVIAVAMPGLVSRLKQAFVAAKKLYRVALTAISHRISGACTYVQK